MELIVEDLGMIVIDPEWRLQKYPGARHCARHTSYFEAGWQARSYATHIIVVDGDVVDPAPILKMRGKEPQRFALALVSDNATIGELQASPADLACRSMDAPYAIECLCKRTRIVAGGVRIYPEAV